MIEKSVLSKVRSLGALCMVLVPLSSSAIANEIWVLPSKNAANAAIGDWATTSRGNTRFGFAVPDNLESFVGAKVVAIGKSDQVIEYDVRLSITQNMKRHDDFTSQNLGLSAALVEDKLLEIDVSSIIPAVERRD